jgi:L-aspartate oxidase
MTENPRDLVGNAVIIGGGVAGLMTALCLAPAPSVLLSKSPLGVDASTPWAQGGLAASLGDDDEPALHLADTLHAGDGLCDAAVSNRIVRAAPAAIDALIRLGVAFDRTSDGHLALGLEAAHSRRRIVHAAGDGTGRELMRALIEAVRRTPSITVIEDVEARRLLVDDNTVVGVLAAGPSGPRVFATRRVVLATGGIGGLFLDTTNPLGCFGQGLALAARAGAELADLEFIQFHPTALDGVARPMKLVSEAVRGEGAVLVDETGRRFLAHEPGAELAPRDVVARGIGRHLADGHRVFLDAREHPGADFARRFPAIAGFCHAAGIDPATQPIPVRPAAHYHMGGVAVDGAGRSSISGLWACGEVASTGLHGANRLASNSLTEAVVCAGWVAESVAATSAGRARRFEPLSLPPPADPTLVRPIMARDAGLLRNHEGLHEAICALLPLASGRDAAADPAIVGLMIVVMALRREESRGAHCRTDFPQRARDARRATLNLADAVATARELDRRLSPTARRA